MADQSTSGTERFKQKPQTKDGRIPLEDKDPNWAWLTLAGFVYLRMASHGIFRCLGLFYMELLDIFNAGPVKTSLVISLFYIFGSLPGPLFGYLLVRLPVRLVIVLSAVIGTLGFVISGLLVSDITGFIIMFCVVSGVITEVTGEHHYNLLLTAGCYFLGAITMILDKMTLSRRKRK